jgi:hypothetical protein
MKVRSSSYKAATEVVKANAVARTLVSYCSGIQKAEYGEVATEKPQQK